MKRQHPVVAALSGNDRYLILDALGKRIDTLKFRQANRQQIRQDLDRLQSQMEELRDRLSDDAVLHQSNVRYLGPAAASVLSGTHHAR